MKYTKEYCKENKVGIKVYSIDQVRKVEKLFNADYSFFEVSLLPYYSNTYLSPSDSSYGDINGSGRSYNLITFEELMQDLNQNNMKRYKNKTTGEIVNNKSFTKWYILEDQIGNDLIPSRFIENSQDWEEVKPELKIGDIVSTLSGFSNDSDKLNYTGAGYKENYIFEVKTVETTSEGFKNKGNQIIWDDKSNGIYSNGIRLATPKEIQQYKESQELKIGDYKLEIIEEGKDGCSIIPGKAKFGCQEFDINELRAFKRLVSSPINGYITIEGVNIDSKFLDKIIAKF